MKVEVTKEIIARSRGIIHSGFPYAATCPIALALKHITRFDCRVYRDHTEIGGKNYWLPPECTYFISQFDKNIPIEPFDFDLERLVAWY